MTLDAFSRPGFHLFNVPILGRDPLDSDKHVLSHKRLQNRKSKDATYLRKSKRGISLAKCIAIRTKDTYRATALELRGRGTTDVCGRHGEPVIPLPARALREIP
jgi:hypothetical protein